MVAEQFESVLDAHVANCPTTLAGAHQLFDQVTVREAPHPSRRGGIEKLSAHLASYLAGEYDAERANSRRSLNGSTRRCGQQVGMDPDLVTMLRR